MRPWLPYIFSGALIPRIVKPFCRTICTACTEHEPRGSQSYVLRHDAVFMIIAMEQPRNVMQVVRKAVGFMCRRARFDELRGIQQDFPDKGYFRRRREEIHIPGRD